MSVVKKMPDNEKDAIQKRQANVAKIGVETENFVKGILESDDYINQHALIIKETKAQHIEQYASSLKIRYDNKNINKEFLMDADIIVHSKIKNEVVCVISVKRSLRERGAQATYWAVKKNQANKPFSYIFVTTDNDEELFKNARPTHRMWRYILMSEFDCVFVVKPNEDHQEYEEPFFKVGKKYLIEFVRALI